MQSTNFSLKLCLMDKNLTQLIVTINQFQNLLEDIILCSFHSHPSSLPLQFRQPHKIASRIFTGNCIKLRYAHHFSHTLLSMGQMNIHEILSW